MSAAIFQEYWSKYDFYMLYTCEGTDVFKMIGNLDQQSVSTRKNM